MQEYKSAATKTNFVYNITGMNGCIVQAENVCTPPLIYIYI